LVQVGLGFFAVLIIEYSKSRFVNSLFLFDGVGIFSSFNILAIFLEDIPSSASLNIFFTIQAVSSSTMILCLSLGSFIYPNGGLQAKNFPCFLSVVIEDFTFSEISFV